MMTKYVIGIFFNQTVGSHIPENVTFALTVVRIQIEHIQGD
jgi:hypothetical protein